MIVVMPGTQAHADPTVAEIEAQISTVWNKPEPLIEQYNGVHEQYMKNKAQQAALAKKLAPLQTPGRPRPGPRSASIAAQVYKGGQANTFNAMVTSGSPKMLAEQLSFLDQLTREQERQLAGVSVAQGAVRRAEGADRRRWWPSWPRRTRTWRRRSRRSSPSSTTCRSCGIKAYGTTGGTGSFRPWPCPSAYAPTNGYKAAAFACSQAGKPYVWAAAGPNSYDCSGLVHGRVADAGRLPAAQRRQAQRSVDGRTSTRANLQVGDLVFYYSDRPPRRDLRRRQQGHASPLSRATTSE